MDDIDIHKILIEHYYNEIENLPKMIEEIKNDSRVPKNNLEVAVAIAAINLSLNVSINVITQYNEQFNKKIKELEKRLPQQD